MVTKDEALDLALDALDNLLYWDNGKSDYDQAREAITAIKQARALDKKAENARELGLDYEPVWDNLPSNKAVEEAMRMKRLNQITTPPADGYDKVLQAIKEARPAVVALKDKPVSWWLDRFEEFVKQLKEKHT